MHEYRSPALKRLNCLLSEMDAAYHEAAQRQGQNDSTSRILYALCELGSPASLRAVCESTGLSKQTVNSALRKLEADGILYLEPSGARSKRVCLTEAGLRVADATAGRLICSQKTFFFRLFSFFQFPFHKTGNPERTVPYLALRQIQLSVPLTEILPHLRVGG